MLISSERPWAITLENSKRHIQMKQNLGSGLIIPNEVKTGYLKTWRCRMRTLFYLSESQMERISPFFPRSHGIPRADGRHVVSGILYVIKHGLQWKDAPAEYGPYKTLYNRFVRLSRLGVFSRIFTELANQTPFDGSLMIDSTHLKAHRTAASLRKKSSPRFLRLTAAHLIARLLSSPLPSSGRCALFRCFLLYHPSCGFRLCQ